MLLYCTGVVAGMDTRSDASKLAGGGSVETGICSCTVAVRSTPIVTQAIHDTDSIETFH